ncbi:MAG: hypothetical protein LBL96_00860, partial [Clostridiales bacterium]|nr:hypothetical protein [Clostridiales bacterium]
GFRQRGQRDIKWEPWNVGAGKRDVEDAVPYECGYTGALRLRKNSKIRLNSNEFMRFSGIV